VAVCPQGSELVVGGGAILFSIACSRVAGVLSIRCQSPPAKRASMENRWKELKMACDQVSLQIARARENRRVRFPVR